jgi:hypothetical protein
VAPTLQPIRLSRSSFFAMCFGLLLGGLSFETLSQTTAASAKADEVAGQHDFDFETGAWTAHLRKLQHPLSGSSSWEEYDGTSVVRRIWDGRANLGELEVSNAKNRIEGLSLRLFNPQSHQWSVSWANARDGALTSPVVGGFRAGRGEFYSGDMLEGKPIFVRIVFCDIKPNSFRVEQAFSGDGGKTWESNWISTFARTNPS